MTLLQVSTRDFFERHFIHNSRFRLFTYDSRFRLTNLASRSQLDCSVDPIRFVFVASQYLHYTRVRPNYSWKDRRDIDDSLGLSTLTLRRDLTYISSVSRKQSVDDGILRRTKPLESSLLPSAITDY